jgi:hypothetical protein
MWKSLLEVIGARVIFGVVHRALASQQAKNPAVQLIGERGAPSMGLL